MRNNSILPFYLIGYRLFRKFGWPRLLPFSVTLSITNQCNSRCKTCNIWKHKPQQILTLSEWEKILKSIGKIPVWFTITGGEPFLNPDLCQIVKYICEYNKPLFINIATNALDSYKIEKASRNIVKICEKNKTRLTINVSIDEIHHKYDYLRGTSAGFASVLKTISILKYIQKNTDYLNIGANIVISRYNIKRIKEIYTYVNEIIKPDTIISEMATPRKLFYIKNKKISPSRDRFLEILDFLISIKCKDKNLTQLLINRFRKKYYKLMKENFLKGTKIPCFACIASTEIYFTGDVVKCCILGDPLGNLRNNNFDFRKIWISKRAAEIRNKIKRINCFCTLSNPFYTNILIRGRIL